MDKFYNLDLQTIMNIDYSGIKRMYIMDMLIAAVVLIVSICLILISMVILHFTINFTMSEEFREIGVMKAIGITNNRIRELYIVKYLAISVIGASIGLVLSFCLLYTSVIVIGIFSVVLIVKKRKHNME